MEQPALPTCDRKLPSILTNNFLRYLFSPPEHLVARYLVHGKRAADLGCGPGFHTLAMARIIGEEGRVYAVDLDPRAIARLQQRARRRRCQHLIEARVTSAAEVDFIESNSIHFVLAEGLLCCMADHAGAVRQIRRILHPEGRAYVSVLKLARAGDPRGVSLQEWERLLASFRLLDSGQGLLTRWALLGPPDGEPTGEQALQETARGHHLSCC